jgi:hypothetical protein
LWLIRKKDEHIYWLDRPLTQLVAVLIAFDAIVKVDGDNDEYASADDDEPDED